jgi:hypothetical protein
MRIFGKPGLIVWGILRGFLKLAIVFVKKQSALLLEKRMGRILKNERF